jgi:OOP family OmpA-OmpF porin
VRTRLLLFGLSLAASASAQGVAIDQYRAAESAIDGFALSRPVDRGHLVLDAQLHLDYAFRPLVSEADPLDPTTVDADLVEHLLQARVGASLGVLDRFLFSVSLPVMLAMEGEPVAGLPSAEGAGVGDVTLASRLRLVGEPSEIGGLALQLTATLPLAEAVRREQELTGESGVTFAPELLGELRPGPVVLTANLGARFRPPAFFTNLAVFQELTWGLGVGVEVIDDLLELRAEGYGAFDLEDLGAEQRRPVEAILGARLRVDRFVVGLAGGPGFGRGYGTPTFRGVLTFGVATDPLGGPPGASSEREDEGDDASEEEGRGGAIGSGPSSGEGAPEDGRDGAPAEASGAASTPAEGGASDAAGDPTTSTSTPTTEAAALVQTRPIELYGSMDRDADRIVDLYDRCPLDREDYDEIQDSDGCPEENADGDRYADVDDRCPLTAGDQRSRDCRGCPRLACISEEGTIEIRQRVEFERDQAVIRARSLPVLEAVLAILSANVETILRVRVEGHTDDQGEDDYNVDLSQRRVAAVVGWLFDRGIARERLEGWGCGEAFPLAPNRTARGRARNRRVEFLIVDPPSRGQTIREGCTVAPDELTTAAPPPTP